MFKVLIDDFKMALSRKDNKVILCILIIFGWFVISQAIIPLLGNIFNAPAINQISVLRLKVPEFFIFFWNIFLYPFATKDIWGFIWSAMIISQFGNILSDFIGGKHFFKIYLLGGFIALFTILIIRAFNVYIYPINSFEIAYGGVGFAIIGIFFAIMALSPTYEVSLFTFRIKLIWLALLFILLNCVYELMFFIPFTVSAAVGHYYILHMKGDWALGAKFVNIFKRKEKKAVFTIHRNTERKEPKTKEYFPTQSEIDRILDKISNEGGYDALTAEEKERLKRASSMKE